MKNDAAARRAGFTLIETLVYLALYAVIILGMLTAAYSLLEFNAHNETAAMVAEEGDYLLAKINTAISGAASIRSPADSGTTLSVIDTDGLATTIEADSSGIRIQENRAAFQTLNNGDVSVVDLVFVHTHTGNSFDPESISVSFTLVATTTDGHMLSRDFTAIEYLHL